MTEFEKISRTLQQLGFEYVVESKEEHGVNGAFAYGTRDDRLMRWGVAKGVLHLLGGEGVSIKVVKMKSNYSEDVELYRCEARFSL